MLDSHLDRYWRRGKSSKAPASPAPISPAAGWRLARRGGRGAVAGDGQAPRADRAVRPLRRKRSGDRSLGAAPAYVPALFCANPANWEMLKQEPEGHNDPEWPIEQVRARRRRRASSGLLGNTKLEKRSAADYRADAARLGRRGQGDAAAATPTPPTASRARTEIAVIPGAGHLAELDKPDEVAAVILGWMR